MGVASATANAIIMYTWVCEYSCCDANCHFLAFFIMATLCEMNSLSIIIYCHPQTCLCASVLVEPVVERPAVWCCSSAPNPGIHRFQLCSDAETHQAIIMAALPR